MSFASLRAAAAGFVLFFAAPMAVAQTLGELIDQYETFNREGDPEEAGDQKHSR